MRAKRKARVRGKISGTAKNQEYLSFKVKIKHIYAQAIDDTKGSL